MKAACHAVPDPALVFRIQSSKAPDKDCDGPFCPLTIPLVDMPVTKGPPIDFLTPFFKKVIESKLDKCNFNILVFLQDKNEMQRFLTNLFRKCNFGIGVDR